MDIYLCLWLPFLGDDNIHENNKAFHKEVR